MSIQPLCDILKCRKPAEDVVPHQGEEHPVWLCEGHLARLTEHLIKPSKLNSWEELSKVSKVSKEPKASQSSVAGTESSRHCESLSPIGEADDADKANELNLNDPRNFLSGDGIDLIRNLTKALRSEGVKQFCLGKLMIRFGANLQADTFGMNSWPVDSDGESGLPMSLGMSASMSPDLKRGDVEQGDVSIGEMNLGKMKPLGSPLGETAAPSLEELLFHSA